MTARFLFASTLLLAACALPAQESAHRSVELVADAAGQLRQMPQGPQPANTLRYWTDAAGGRLLRAGAHTLDAEVVAAGLETPYGLGFDAGAQRFVWTSSGAATVQVLASGRGEVRTLQTSFEQPASLELAQESGRQALSLDGERVLRVSEDALSGETRRDILATLPAGTAPHGLALDAQAGVLYIGNAVGMMVFRLDLADGRLQALSYTDHAPPVADADAGDLP